MLTATRYLITGMILLMLPALALSEQINVNVKIKIVTPPCTINNGQPIDIDFGDVETSSIDGIAYQMPVNYSLLCSGLSSPALKMQIAGVQASFDSSAVEVSGNPGMGIRIMRDGQKQDVNSWFNFNYTGPASAPKLYVVPVKAAGSTLTEGIFSAIATLKVDYQ